MANQRLYIWKNASLFPICNNLWSGGKKQKEKHLPYSKQNLEGNDKKSIYWYTRALELGMQSSTEHQIGWCYEKLGDFDHAVEWYIKGAGKGIGDTAYHLAELYETGVGVPKDFKKAIEWY